MDRKTLIIVVISCAMLFLWPFLTNKLFPPKKIPGGTNRLALASHTNTALSNMTQSATGAVASVPVPMESAEVRPLVTSGAPEEIIELETADSVYHFTSYGGGIKI